MTIQTKIILSITLGISAIYVTSQVIQDRLTGASISALAAENLKKETNIQWTWIATVQHAARSALLDAMNSGDMDKVHYLIEENAKIPGVQEVSIGHALIGDALEFGYGDTVKRYLQCIQDAEQAR